MIFFFPFSLPAPRLCLSPYLLHSSLPLCCSHSNFCVPLCPTLYGQISREDSLPYAEAVFILCRDRDRTCSHTNGSATCSSTRFRPGALETQVYNMPACCLFRKMAGLGVGRRSDNNGTNETCHFSPSTSFHFPPFPSFELRSTEHPDCLFGSGIIFHVYDTSTKWMDGEARREQMIEGASSVSEDAHYSLFPPLISSIAF